MFEAPQTVREASEQLGSEPTQVAPSPTALPQAPQWLVEVAMSVQVPLQRTHPVGQDAPPMQDRLLQVCP